MDKVVYRSTDAIEEIPDGATLSLGGFGLCGIPNALTEALSEAGTKDLVVASNNAGVDDIGLGLLLRERRLRKIVCFVSG